MFGLAGQENQPSPEDVWLFGLGTPGLQKKTWPKKHLGIPLTMDFSKFKLLLVGAGNFNFVQCSIVKSYVYINPK